MACLTVRDLPERTISSLKSRVTKLVTAMESRFVE